MHSSHSLAMCDFRLTVTGYQSTCSSWLQSTGLLTLALCHFPGTGEEQEEKVEYLVSLGLAQETVADIIGRWPQLLRLSLRKNIIPVIKYLESAWIAFRPEQIVELLNKYPQVSRRPQCFARSF